MGTFESQGSFNPRSTNGSALDFMNFNPYGTQQGASFQQPFSPQAQPQSPYAQTPWQQSFQGPPWQQPFGGTPQMQSPMFGSTPYAQPIQASIAYGQPWGAQPQMSQPGIAPPTGVPVQNVVPVVTTRSAELRVTLPVHRIINKHPQEIVQYLTYVVLPVLLEGLVKRSAHPEPGLSVSNDLRGECVAEIEI